MTFTERTALIEKLLDDAQAEEEASAGPAPAE